MTVKNVLNGLKEKYTLMEINILTDEKVVFSGTVDQWNTVIDPYLLEEKRKILAVTIKKRMMFNGRKVFLFIEGFE